MSKKKKAAGRLAIRTVGIWTKAYYAETDTMKDALLLAMIQRKFMDNPKRRHEFTLLMQQCVSDIIEEVFGTRPVWPEGPQPAPEHERGKGSQ